MRSKQRHPGAALVGAGWITIGALVVSAERLMDTMEGVCITFGGIALAWLLLTMGERVNAAARRGTSSTTASRRSPFPVATGKVLRED